MLTARPPSSANFERWYAVDEPAAPAPILPVSRKLYLRHLNALRGPGVGQVVDDYPAKMDAGGEDYGNGELRNEK
jgi:hypothetical protein